MDKVDYAMKWVCFFIFFASWSTPLVSLIYLAPPDYFRDGWHRPVGGVLFILLLLWMIVSRTLASIAAERSTYHFDSLAASAGHSISALKLYLVWLPVVGVHFRPKGVSEHGPLRPD